MSTRKSAVFYGVLIALASLVVGMVIASRLDLAPASFAGPLDVPATNSAPLTRPDRRHDVPAPSPTTRARAVVSIATRRIRQARDGNELFQFPGAPPFGGGRRQTAQGSCRRRAPAAASSSTRPGYILTNNHVVEDATDIEVQLANMRNGEPGLQAKLVGRDVLTDTALHADRRHARPAARGSEVRRLGADRARRLGHGDRQPVPPLEHRDGRRRERRRPDRAGASARPGPRSRDDSDRRGHQSRQLRRAAAEPARRGRRHQHDDLQRRRRGGNVGIGFAVPINIVRDILPQLRQGKVVRGRIGVSLSAAPDHAAGHRRARRCRAGGRDRLSARSRTGRRRRPASGSATSSSSSTARP